MITVFAFVLGASVGSFVNVVVDRLPAGQSLIRPASHCPVCKAPLRVVDLVPVLSYLWLRGRCGHCGAHIPVRILGVAVLSGLLFVGVWLRYGIGPGFAVVTAARMLLLAIATIDLERELILNKVVFPSLAAAVALAPFWTILSFERSFLGSNGVAAGSFSS